MVNTISIPLEEMVLDFARAFKAVDAARPQGRSKTRQYLPGIGPLSESEAIRLALEHLKRVKPAIYELAAPKPYPGGRQLCDCVIPDAWALEFKLVRPFGDNGIESEHWSENVLHPYPGNVSAIGDCLKLRDSRFVERRAVLVFGFEHSAVRIPLATSIDAFELLATHLLRIRLGPRSEADFEDLIHPCHQRGRLFGWEILG